MINIFCIGDPHFKDDNIRDVEILIEEILKKVKEIKPDFVVIMGDTLHTNEKALQQPFQKATQFIEKLAELTTVYLLIGNHDYINASQFLTDNHFFIAHKHIKNVHVVDHTIVQVYEDENDKEYKFWFLPYVANGKFIDALNTYKDADELWEFADCIFAHQEFMGCKMGAFLSEKGDIWDEDYPLVISGHIHEHQIINNIFYTGSIMQHGYAVEGDKKLWHFTFDSQDDVVSYKYQGYDLGIKQKKIIDVDYNDIKNFEAIKYKDFSLKLNVRGTSEQLKIFRTSKIYKNLLSQNIKINLVSTVSEIQPEIRKKFAQKSSKSYLDIFQELCGEELKDICKEVVSHV